MRSYEDMVDKVVAESAESLAAEMGITQDEAEGLVNDALGALGIGGREPRRFEPTPWETIRRTVKPPKGQSWTADLAWYRENAHEVWVAANGWKHHVLKSYQRSRGEEDRDQYARALCLVDGYESEIGDVYWREITSGQRIR